MSSVLFVMRARLGELSLRQAAKLCGVSHSTFYRWETTRRWPVGTLHKLDPETYTEADEERVQWSPSASRQ